MPPEGLGRLGQAELSPALCWVEVFVGRCSISSTCLLKQAGFQCRKLEICCQHYRTPFSLPIFHIHPTSCSQTRVPREGDGQPVGSSQQPAALLLCWSSTCSPWGQPCHHCPPCPGCVPLMSCARCCSPPPS